MTNITSDADIAALKDDFAGLRKDMAALADHIRGNVINRAGDAGNQLNAGARDLYSAAAANGEQSAKVVYKQIEEHPVVTALLVLGVAFLGGRFLTRS